MKIVLENDIDENLIILQLDEQKCVWIDFYNIDYTTKETTENFCKMLIDGFDKCKNEGIETHKQYISNSELSIMEYLNNDDRWEIVDKNNDTMLIECSIDDAPVCIIEAFFGECLES